MEEKSLTDLLANLIPAENENMNKADEDDAGSQYGLLAAGLKALAAQSGGLGETVVNEFLKGEGDLHERTRAASVRGTGIAESDVTAFLVEKFNLSTTVARLIAPLLLKLLPSVLKEKKKSQRKTKPKPKPGSGKTTASSKKKTKKDKPSKPRTSASKPKRKTGSAAVDES